MEPKLNRLLNDSQALYGLYFHTADFDVFFFFSPFAGHRNKWKRMFFVLDGDEQHLYFFENEKV